MKRRLICLLLLLLCGVALAQEESETGVNARIVVGEPQGSPLSGAELDRITEDVAGRMRCPVCQGLSVADSPAPAAVAMKTEVRELLAGGFTPEQTIRYFETSYGEFIRLEPEAKGFNLVVWIAPAAILLLGAVIIGWRLRRGRARPSTAESSGAPRAAEDPELAAYRERVRQEIGAAPAQEIDT